MTDAVNNLLNNMPEDDGIQRDQYGRYVLADPTTGEIKSWTRATTLSSLLDDTKALDTWKARNLAFGIGRREDLFALAASVGTPSESEDKKVLDTVIGSAREAAAEDAKANLGTALHGFTQRHDLGEKGVEVPEAWADDVKAYLQAFKHFGMWPHEQFVEKVLIIPELESAGTVDRLLMCDVWDVPRISDLKTGRVDGKGRAFAVQLAIYANASHWYDPKTKTYHEMPKVDLQKGMVIHLPVEQGRCDMYEVDIVAGWEAARLAYDVHKWRKRNDLSVMFSKPDAYVDEAIEDAAKERKPKTKRKRAVKSAPDVATVDSPDEKPEPTHRKCIVCNDSVLIAEYEAHIDGHLFAARLAWALARVKYVAAEHKQIDALAEFWPGDIPTFKQGGPRTHEEIDRVGGACALVEMAKKLPFFEPDPAKAKETINQWLGENSNEQLAISK